jgi:hypothetical protein
MNIKQTPLLLTIIFCLGCMHKPNKVNITITLTDSNRSVKISGLDQLVVADIARDSSGDVWQALVPVYKMPADTDMKDFQSAQPGRYKVKDSVVVFTPDTPFRQGQAYFARYYLYDGTKNAWQYLREKKGKGSARYKDLLFRY